MGRCCLKHPPAKAESVPNHAACAPERGTVAASISVEVQVVVLHPHAWCHCEESNQALRTLLAAQLLFLRHIVQSTTWEEKCAREVEALHELGACAEFSRIGVSVTVSTTFHSLGVIVVLWGLQLSYVISFSAGIYGI